MAIYRVKHPCGAVMYSGSSAESREVMNKLNEKFGGFKPKDFEVVNINIAPGKKGTIDALNAEARRGNSFVNGEVPK